jgi:hypothetical protein
VAIRVVLALLMSAGAWLPADAQEQSSRRATAPNRGARSTVTATIHWEDVPLREALERLEKLFGEPVFVDRRVDPTVRITYGARGSSEAEVLTPIAAEHGWGVARIGGVTYLGPQAAAQQLRRIAAERRGDAAHLTGKLRQALERKQSTDWERLAEPRELVSSLIEKSGWQSAGVERIPHDLWRAGRLPDLSLADQLTVLLIGFDLTFQVHAAERTIEIVPLAPRAEVATDESAPNRARQTASPKTAPKAGTKQVYSLRVTEKPVGAVMRELARRLNWQVEFDDTAIAKAGLSLDTRVSFNVENLEQDGLMHAVLQPAGMTFRREGERIVVAPIRVTR